MVLPSMQTLEVFVSLADGFDWTWSLPITADAMEWTSEVIQIWNFGPNNIPSNLKNGNPDTSTWGTPQFTTAQGSCDIDAHFQDQQVVFNTDFCGSYAGLDYFWQQTSCYKSNPTKYATCVDYVAANPAMYENAFWTINSLKVYQKTNVVSSSSSSTQSSTYVFLRSFQIWVVC
jgi:hypothetical protein